MVQIHNSSRMTAVLALLIAILATAYAKTVIKGPDVL
jgi:hypothetical protein